MLNGRPKEVDEALRKLSDEEAEELLKSVGGRERVEKILRRWGEIK